MAETAQGSRDPVVFGPALPPPDTLVQVEPCYQVTCRICGPLDSGLHDSSGAAETDRAAHLESHAEGLYSWGGRS
jgi:hypothetical protein